MPSTQGPWGTRISCNERAAHETGLHVPVTFKTPMLWDGLTNPKQLHPLELTTRLGIPLIFMTFGAAIDAMIGDKQHNDAVAALSIVCDTTTPHLRATMRTQVSFDAVICRADGHDLEPANLEAMLEFVKTEMRDAVAYASSTAKGADAERRARVAWNMATAQAFRTFYEAYRTTHQQEMGNAKSLFDAREPICKACGKQGEGLVKCASCTKVSYCSKDCQRKDWKLHKSAYH